MFIDIYILLYIALYIKILGHFVISAPISGICGSSEGYFNVLTVI